MVETESRNFLNNLTQEELLEDYLNEQEVKFELSPKDIGYLKGKTIMVLGAGGTVGAEMVRQLINKKTKQIISIDNYENGIYNIKRELEEVYKMSNPRVICFLGDIRNKKRIESIFTKYQPNIIFHYANYKSLVVGNISPEEFANVNIGGTRNLLEIASECPSVERFIYVSSDKAEYPSQNYGRTKRISELLIQTFASKTPNIRFGTMRYCNILDTAGSFAVTTFKDQIINEKPITIRKMNNNEIPTRYFIPIHTAAKLTIKVGYECNKGDIFSLDKVLIKPIKIDDLAKMLAKKLGIPDVESWFAKTVKYIPSERGEKKAEQLGKGESLPDCPLIKIPPEKYIDIILFNKSIDELLSLCDDINKKELVEKSLEDILELFNHRGDFF